MTYRCDPKVPCLQIRQFFTNSFSYMASTISLSWCMSRKCLRKELSSSASLISCLDRKSLDTLVTVICCIEGEKHSPLTPHFLIGCPLLEPTDELPEDFSVVNEVCSSTDFILCISRCSFNSCWSLSYNCIFVALSSSLRFVRSSEIWKHSIVTF